MTTGNNNNNCSKLNNNNNNNKKNISKDGNASPSSLGGCANNSQNMINNNNNNSKNQPTTTTTTTIKRLALSSGSIEFDLKRELELKSMELMRKDQEIAKLREINNSLEDKYQQEVSICCSYSTILTNLQKELCKIKSQFLSKEDQYKKQIQDLQHKLYCTDSIHQSVGGSNTTITKLRVSN
eukprot:gene1557-1975_t